MFKIKLLENKMTPLKIIEDLMDEFYEASEHNARTSLRHDSN